MMSRPGKYKIRSFDGWGAVYDLGRKVYEGDTDHCIDFVFERVGVVHVGDDAFLADHGRAADTDKEASEYRP